MSTVEAELADPLLLPNLAGASPEPAPPGSAVGRTCLAFVGKDQSRCNAFRSSCGLSALDAGVVMDDAPSLEVLIAPSALRFGHAHRLPESIAEMLADGGMKTRRDGHREPMRSGTSMPWAADSILPSLGSHPGAARATAAGPPRALP